MSLELGVNGQFRARGQVIFNMPLLSDRINPAAHLDFRIRRQIIQFSKEYVSYPKSISRLCSSYWTTLGLVSNINLTHYLLEDTLEIAGMSP